jgi:hypothetical protein
MVGPWLVLAAGSAAATTDVEDVDGSPPGRCCRDFRQRPPPMLKTSMASLLGVLVAGPTAATTDVEDVDGGPLGVAVGISAVATTDIEDVDGGAPGGCYQNFR